MCVYSMIMDHYKDKWKDYQQPQPPWSPLPPTSEPFTVTPPAPITPEELVDLRKLLERAKEYDTKNGEPECELESKKETLRKLAEQLGVDIEFP